MVRKRIESVETVPINSQQTQQHGRRAPLLETINALSVDSDPEYSDTEPIKHISIDDDILDDEEDEEFERMLQQSASQPVNNNENKQLKESSSKSKDMRFLMQCRSRRPLEQNAENVLDSADNSWNAIPSKGNNVQSNGKRSVRFNSDVQITSLLNNSTVTQQNRSFVQQNIAETITESVPVTSSIPEKTKPEVKLKERFNFFERIRDNISSTRESKKKKESKDQSNVNITTTITNPAGTVSHKESSTNGMQNNREIKSKSILKDPLCAKLRSEISTGQFALSSFSQLENEIDALLCGEKKNKQMCDTLTKQRIHPRITNQSNISFLKQKFNQNKNDFQISTQQNDVYNDSELALTAKTNNKAKALKRCSINVKTSNNELPSLLQSNQYLYQFRPGSPSLFDSISGSVPRIHVPTPPSSDQFLSNIRDEIQTPQIKEANNFFNQNNAQLEYSLFVDPVTGPSINRLMEHLSRSYATNQEAAEDCLSVSTRSVPENHIYEEILYECLERNSNQIGSTNVSLQHSKSIQKFNSFTTSTSQEDNFQNATII